MKKNIEVKKWEDFIKSYVKKSREERFEFLKTVHKKAKKMQLLLTFFTKKNNFLPQLSI